MVTVLPLFKALRNVSKRSMMLTKEVKMLAAISLVFTVNYVTRTIYDFTVGVSIDFRALYSGLLLPIFWDILPIGLMMFYHIKATFEKKKRFNNISSSDSPDHSKDHTIVSGNRQTKSDSNLMLT